MAEIILTYISLSIALASIFFVLWDHYKDDRLLTKRVKAFYEDIEGLIYSWYQMKLNLEKFNESGKNSSYEEEFFKYEKKNVFYRGIIAQYFEDMAKYLGLTYYNRPNLYYSNDNEYLIEQTGAFHNFICKLPQVQIGHTVSFYDNQIKKIVINKDSIKIMNNVLETLRNHWNTYYYKKVLRKKLKPKLDFSELLNFD